MYGLSLALWCIRTAVININTVRPNLRTDELSRVSDQSRVIRLRGRYAAASSY